MQGSMQDVKTNEYFTNKKKKKKLFLKFKNNISSKNFLPVQVWHPTPKFYLCLPRGRNI